MSRVLWPGQVCQDAPQVTAPRRRATSAQRARGMPVGHDLWHWCDPALPQAGATDHKIGHEPEQAIVDIVVRGRGTHRASPWDGFLVPKCTKKV